MIYLLDKFDLDVIKTEKDKYHYIQFDFWECPEERVTSWLRFERSRSLFDKTFIANLFNIDYPFQMVKTKEIKLKKFDKLIIWTPGKKYFVFKVIDFIK